MDGMVQNHHCPLDNPFAAEKRSIEEGLCGPLKFPRILGLNRMFSQNNIRKFAGLIVVG